MVTECIRSESGSIGYDRVAAFYRKACPDVRRAADLRAKFRYDCQTLEEHYSELVAAYLEPFFLPLPEIKYDEKTKCLVISSGRRPIAVETNKHVDQLPQRRALARFVVTANWPNERPDRPLIPRGAHSLFAGTGTTICLIFRELLWAAGPRVPELTVYTSSAEIAGLFYYLHQGAGAEFAGLRVGDNLVDRKEGAVLPLASGALRDGSLDVAVISCHALRQKQFITMIEPEKHTLFLRFLERADRIVIVAEHWKFGRGDGFPMSIPGLGTKPVLLVSDAEEAALPPLPDGVNFLQAPRGTG